MSRILILAATAVFFASQMLMPAQASTVTYDLTLTATLFGPENGTGSLSVNGPITSGMQTFTSAGGGGLSSLSFLINGNNFTLGNGLGTSTATFFNGNLINLAYAGVLGGMTLSLNTAGLIYSYFDFSNLRLDSAGTISASATPLPETWTMMLAGLVGFGFFLYRRKRPDALTGMVAA